MAARRTAAQTVAGVNPFRKATEEPVYIKTLFFGLWGSGKTHTALTAPGPIAMFDTEGGAVMFAGKFDFDRQGSKSYADLIAAIDFIEANPGAYGTLIVDPVTTIYDALQEAALKVRTARAARKAERERREFDADSVDLEMMDWGRIKRSYKALMARLVNLPCHVILTARERDDVEMRGGEAVKIGTRPDSEKGTPYFFDVVLHAEKVGKDKRRFTVEKARGVAGDILPLGSQFIDPDFDTLFGGVLKAMESARKDGTLTPRLQDDEATARKDAEALGETLAGPEMAAELAAALIERGYDPEEVRASKGWAPFADMPRTAVADALAKVKGPKAPPAAENGAQGAEEASSGPGAPEVAPEPSESDSEAQA